MLTDGPSFEEQAVIAQHLAYLTELTEQGLVIMADRTLNTDSSAFCIVTFWADSEAEAICDAGGVLSLSCGLNGKKTKFRGTGDLA